MRGHGPGLGLDIGGSKIEGVVLDEEARVEARARLPIATGIEGVLDTAMAVIDELAKQTGRSAETFGTLGVGVPGQVDRTTGTVRHAYNLGVDELALGPALHERTGLPVSVDNDVTAAAFGAAHLMELDGTVVYLNLGTGLAAGIVVDGQPQRGANGFAGEIGHLPISPLQRQCPCGQRGCLETVASGSALKAHWPTGGEHPGRTLMAAIASGDDTARAEFDHLVWGASSAIRVLGLTIDPDAIVIGGGLRLLGAPLFEGILFTLEEWGVQSPFVGELRLGHRVQLLADDSPAAAVGAALASAA